jgi:hypothetical protein
MMNYAALGDVDQAFRWLEYEPHHTWTAWIRVLTFNQGLNAMRRDPRFPDYLRRMNLPPLPSS